MKNRIIAKILTISIVASVLAGFVGVPMNASAMSTGKALLEKTKGRIPQDTWTAREVPEGTIVTLMPDYSADNAVETSTIKNGGFESTNSWSDDLNTVMFWQDGGGENNPVWKPWTFSTDVKLEGRQSGCVDVSLAMAEKSKMTSVRLPIMEFVGVNIVPCFANEVYHLRFYVKADRELEYENPQLMVYLLDPSASMYDEDVFGSVIGTPNIVLDASNIDYHWYDQKEIKFEHGQNPTGKYAQGFGPFYQGKWIQIDSYFVTPEDFKEGAYSLQIRTLTGADCKLYFDAFSLEKTTIEQVDLGIGLTDPNTSSTPAPTPIVGTDGDYDYKVGTDGKLEITKYTGDKNILDIPDEINGYKVTSIGERAFSGNTKLQNVYMPEYLETIGEYAFSSCALLSNVSFNNIIKTIGEYAFFDCPSLLLVPVPESVSDIGDYAFGFNVDYKPILGFSIIGYSKTAAETYAEVFELAFNDMGNTQTKKVTLKFTKKSVKIKRGKKAILKVKLTGAKKATFTTSKKKVVKIVKKKAKKVVIKGLRKGKAVITAKAAGKKAKCKVTVR